jgi:hypothetical protein
MSETVGLSSVLGVLVVVVVERRQTPQNLIAIGRSLLLPSIDLARRAWYMRSTSYRSISCISSSAGVRMIKLSKRIVRSAVSTRALAFMLDGRILLFPSACRSNNRTAKQSKQLLFECEFLFWNFAHDITNDSYRHIRVRQNVQTWWLVNVLLTLLA